MNPANFDFSTLITKAIEEAMNKRGRVNILIAGKAGVGKSTLINNIFQGRFAETGDGRPVTKETREIKKEGMPLSIFDTRGLELKDFQKNIRELEKVIKERKKDTDPNRHIHVAWLCISEDSKRVEDAEINLVKMLDRYIPVVAVVTKSYEPDNQFKHEVQKWLPDVRNVVRVLAEPKLVKGGHTIKPYGLDDLIDMTTELIPESQRNALAAVQKVSFKNKMMRAHGVVGAASIIAGTIAAVPIPFSDAIALVPTQVSMLAGISAVWGLPISTATLGTLVSGSITGTAGTIGGRAAATGLFKLIPGFGVVIQIISASVATTITATFGEAYIGALYALTKDDPQRIPRTDELFDEFKKQISQSKNILNLGRNNSSESLPSPEV